MTVQRENKKTKVIKEINEVLIKYSTNEEYKKIYENLNEGDLKDKVDDKILCKLIHEQHNELINDKEKI